PSGVKAALRVRGVGDRAIVDPEDEPLFRAAGRPVPQAQGYAVVDLVIGYQRPRFEFLLTVENLFDTKWREAQFANRSCSRAENTNPASPCYLDAGGVRPREADILPDVHFTPGNPINVMATERLYF